MSESDVCKRQIMTYKNGPRAEKVRTDLGFGLKMHVSW